MMTIDNLLVEILCQPDDYAKSVLTKRDFDTLTSLEAATKRPTFITESQSRLLVKILKENQKKLTEFDKKITEAIVTPVWSKSFRQIEQIRTLTIENDRDNGQFLTIEFTFNPQIRKILGDLNKVVEGNFTSNGKFYQAELTEKNIVLLVDTLAPFDFTIDGKIQDFYKIIKSWSKTEFENQYLITNFENKNFQKYITEDLGIETSIDQNIINDRSVRYQYFVENPKNPGENLVEFIANRSETKVWINKNEHTMTEILDALNSLKRLPTLVVFENSDDEKSLKNLEILKESLENNGLDSGIGIYFRLPNNQTGQKFNQLIKDNKFNHPLDNTTKIAVVQSGKIPKFFLKNTWQPMSVIALDTKMGLRHGKTSVYSNCCDLIIEWADAPVLFEKRTML
jgi:hypothetical protein